MSRKAEAASGSASVLRGAMVNLVGTGARAATPLVLIAMTRLYGPSLVGAYAIAIALLRIVETMLSSGFRDAMVFYGGRYAHRDDDHSSSRLYEAFAHSTFWVTASSIALASFVFLVPSVLEANFPQAGAVVAIRWIALALPFVCLREMFLAGTRSLMVMRHTAFVNGVIGPLSLLGFTLLGALYRPSLDVLMGAVVLSQVATTLWAARLFGRHFSPVRFAKAMFPPKIDRELFGFAIPQNLNMTFTQFVSSVDVVMLGLFGVAAPQVAFYSIGAQITRELRTFRRSFSSVLSPLISRLHGEGRLSELETQFVSTSRWTLMATVPLALVLLCLIDDVLLVFHPTFSGDTTFVWLLTVNPLMAAAVGMAGNVLVMTGFSKWNLFNSLLSAGLNVGLNVALIPRFGLTGAAAATMASGVFITILQLVETRLLVGVGTSLRGLSRPLLAGLVGGAVAALGWAVLPAPGGVWIRIAITVVALASYAGALWAQGLSDEDRNALTRAFGPRRRRAP